VPTVTQLIYDAAEGSKLNIDLIYPWNLPGCVYPTIINLLNEDNFTYFMLKGLCVSVGGITDSTSTVSSDSLIKLVKNYGNQQSLYTNLFSNI